MLLPDQTYADYVDRHLTKPDCKDSNNSNSNSNSNNSYERTADFFEHIPDFEDTSLPAFFSRPQSSTLSPDDPQDAPETLRTQSAESDLSECSQRDNCGDMLRLCEDFLCRHRMRADFFCQYHKALSSTTPSPKLSKPLPLLDKHSKLDASKDVDSVVPSTNKFGENMVERFTKFSAIYTLPVARRRKTCNKTSGNKTDFDMDDELIVIFF